MTATTTRERARSVRGARPTFAHASPYLALAVFSALLASMGSLPAGVSAQAVPAVVVSEVLSVGNNNGTYAADWFEVSNVGTTAVDLTSWKVDDNSNAFANAVALRGVTSLPPGTSAVFIEGLADGSTDSDLIASFSTAWFGSATLPIGVVVGTYGGAGIGFGTSGDSVNLFDAGGNRVTGVSFGAAATGSPVATFDNAAGLGGATLPLPTISTLSTGGVNGGFLSSNGAEIGSPGLRIIASPVSGVDLSTYVRIGRFDLPEPMRTAAPPNSVLAQEVSAVTVNRDTDTLFVVGDRGTSIVQVSKTGQLIDSMTLALGSSPQGTDFFDPEGLTYVGAGRFVMVEERDRQAVLFTYAAGATLTRGDTQTVKLGTFAGNEGIEGISYDPQTNGFIAVKEINPLGIFQTGIDFAAGTATNGSATTANSINLFDPALVNTLDFADVFALSNLPSLSGPEASHLLVLSQESGTIANIDRNGLISSVLTIASDPTNPLSVADQQHEGLTMDGNGVLYVVSENGGGDMNHPQLWVYAPSQVPNQPPTAIVLSNVVASMAENTSTAARLRVADITVTDDGLGVNTLRVSGTDAGAFEVDSSGLYIKAGTILDFETKASYSVTVEVDDIGVGATPDASAPYSLSVTDIVNEDPPVPASLVITEVTPWASGNAPYGADWFEVTNIGAGPVDVTGWKMDDDSGSFATGVALTGVTTIAPGTSAIFIETSDLATTKAAFLTAWFGASPPADLQIGSYSGGGVGLSTGGDSVHLFDATGNRVTGVSFGASTTGFTFDNAAGLGSSTPPLPAIAALSVVGIHGAFLAADGAETGSPGTIAGGVVVPRVIVSEVTPWASGNAPYAADWFEITNIGASPVDITGWKMDDDSGSFANGVVLNGVTTIAPGTSAILIETSDLATTKAAFLAAWFGATPPADLQVGSYSGGGVGLSTGGDSVNLFDASGNRVTGVSVGASTAGFTFDNAAGLGGTALPLPAVSTLSVAGVNGAFLAADGAETGSPGRIANPIVLPPLVITEVTPWASGNAPYAADWFEITNIGTSPVDVTGWKMDDDSGSFANGVVLTGITSIASGESAIFIETSDLATTKAAFLTAWFGATPPADLQVGSYSGGGVGLSTGGDSVHLFDASGNRVTGVRVGASTAGTTFDNAAGLGSSTSPLPTIATLSAVGVNGAFLASDGTETGSPGSIGLDKTPPVIDPVADLIVEATGSTGAIVPYTLPATLDDVDGAGVAACLPAPGTTFALGTTTVTCTAQDAAGNTASSTFGIVVRDTTPPAVTVPPGVSATTTVATGVQVTFTASATDIVDGSRPVTCSPASGSTFPVGTTTVSCTSTDIAGNAGAATFIVTVTVTAPPSTPDGRIHGLGHIDDAGKRHQFAFRVSEAGNRDYGRFEYWVSDRRLFGRDDDYSGRDGGDDRNYGRDHRQAPARFEATSITSVVFSDDPGFRPGRGFFFTPPRVDSVSFSGTGKWNGKAGYTFRVTATDQGEPGRRHDTFQLVIEDALGRIVATVNGGLDGGNIQSTRLGRFGWF